MSEARAYPSDWRATTLGALADYVNGYPFNPRDWTTVGLPIVRIAQMTDTTASFDYFADPLPPDYQINSGDLLFSWSATLTALVWQRGPAYLNQHIYKVIPRNDNNLRFLHHLLNWLIDPLASQSHGTTMKHVTRADLLPYPVTVPSPTEQSRIAAVLDTVDEAIAKTEAVIAKLKQVRAGLLHDLLARGLDENGQLRDPIAHPEQFQDSLIGRIPREWVVASLGYFLASAEYGISTSLNSEGMLPVLRMNNFAGGEAVLADIKFATRTVPDSLLLQDGDVLFNRTNSYEHVGRTGIWRNQFLKATFASYLVRLNPIASRLSSEFLNLMLNTPEVQQRMRQFATPAVQQVNINPTSLQQMLVAAPKKVDEQDQIGLMALQSAESVIAEDRELRKLQQLKSALMTDLLTGRVRVPADLDFG
jgi:type I restriction enzyme S subunit